MSTTEIIESPRRRTATLAISSTKLTQKSKEKSRVSAEEWREFTKTVWHIANTTHPDHPAVFPPEIPRRLVKLFSFFGELVLDPFAGTGTTGRVAMDLGRRAVCVEQNPGYAKGIVRTCVGCDVHEADSRDMGFLPDNSIDLIITSPPYWNKADYGRGAANLGTIGNYREFLVAIRPTFAECARVLRPGRKFCLVTANVNQHTDCGLLTFPLAADFTQLLRDVGLVMVNEVIWSKDGTGGRWGSANGQRPIFGSYPYPPNFLFKNVHEHVLIFAKPPVRPVKGPKVVAYEAIMRAQSPLPRNGKVGTAHASIATERTSATRSAGAKKRLSVVVAGVRGRATGPRGRTR